MGMRRALGAAAVLTALIATNASAQVQGVDLNGRWVCVTQCLAAPGSFVFITQYGWQFNVVNEVGQASQGQVDYPGRIWLFQANRGAIYSPDGLTIQFDGGTIWQRAPVLPPPLRRRG
jgi:hypothetical protein